MRRATDSPRNTGQVTDELRVKRKLSGRRRRIRSLAIALLVVLTAAYAVWSILFVMTGKGEEVRLAFLRYGTVDRTETCPLIFLDNGTAVMAPSGGLLVPLLEDGQRVAKETELALILPPDKEEEALLYREARAAYNARLLVVSGFADPVRFQSPRSPADSRLRQSIMAMLDLDCLSGTKSLYYKVEAFRQEMQGASSEAALFAGLDEELTRLALECDGLLAFLMADPRTRVIRAPMAGEVCFTGSDLPLLDPVWQEMQRDLQEAALRWTGLPNKRHDGTYNLVVQGERIASIRRFSGMSAAAYLDNQAAGLLALKKGDRIDLSHPETGLYLEGCLVEKAEKIGPGHLYLFACDQVTCSWPRHVAEGSITLIAGQSSGLRVPLASLFDLDQMNLRAGLRCIRGGVTETVEVEILAKDDTHALIQALEGGEKQIREADLYVVNPWSAEDGKLID